MNAPREERPAGSAGWYYRLDGREHGPMALTALQDLVGSSGETVTAVDVRQGLEADWVPFEAVFKSPAAAPFPSQQREGSAAKGSAASLGGFGLAGGDLQRVPQPRRMVRQTLREHADIAIAVAVWILVNVVILGVWSQSYRAERRYLATLRELHGEVKALQAHDSPQEEWAALRNRAKERLQPIVTDLKKTANASEPIRQHLLWAARDQFPKLVGPKNSATKDAERLYEQHMKFVEHELAGQ